MIRDIITKRFRQKAIKKYKPGITQTGKNNYIFISNEFEVIPFVLKKEPKAPLFIYLCGSASMGHHNIANRFEFWIKGIKSNIAKKKANIVLPQFLYHSDYMNYIDKFSSTVADLTQCITTNFDIDEKRIYLFGTSLGGYCVYQLLLKNNELYTAYISTVGGINDYNSLSSQDIDTLENSPLWIVHAQDDKSVSIDSDDYIASKMTSNPPKYTRYKSGGHSVSNKFYRKEPWLDWLLSKTK